MFSFKNNAHNEHNDQSNSWDAIPEGADLLPEVAPLNEGGAFQGAAGLMGQEPYSPAVAHGMTGRDAEADKAEKTDADGQELPDGDLNEITDPETHESKNDPLGSWTGVPDPNIQEIPTQDQDDL